LSAIYLSRLCLLKVHVEISSSPLLWCVQCTLPPLLHVPFQFLVYYSVVVVVFWGRGQSVQGAMLVYPRSSCWNTICHLFAHLLVRISQAGLEPVSGGAGALLFSQCKVAWRSFVWARGTGCLSFASSWWFFSAKCGSSISGKFLIYGAHGVCFLPLASIFHWIKIS
jgi:hypothetical protein